MRFIVDLRGVKRKTVLVERTMRDIKGMCRSVARSTVFVKIDMCHVYW